MKNKFYITTTLPYVNADPHIGFAMEIIRADATARYHRMLGEEVVFNTGTDEHGQKIYLKAKEEGMETQKYCDIRAENYKNLKQLLNLSFTNFIRTTDDYHVEAAKEFWKRCDKNGDIYKAKYQIKYCVGCELEKTDSELVDGRCPIHPQLEIQLIDEENYFFKWSKYQQPLLELYDKNQDFVIPHFRLEEIKKFVQEGLKDFSISRLKTKMPWGIEVPGDPEQVMYVWFDALVDYISTLGWPENKENFVNFWPGVQFAGKDNLRQQAAMWQAMLMSAGLPNSRQIYVEGFITSNGQKMSKSLGNVVDPVALVKQYGVDAVRYYLLREIPAYDDGDYSERRFKEIYNADLANGLGNLVARVAKLCETSNLDVGVSNVNDFYLEVKIMLDQYQFNEALVYLWTRVAGLNKYLNDKKPWEKSGFHQAVLLGDLVENIRELTYNLKPFLPETAEKIEKQFTGPKIKSAEALYPRLS